MREVGPDFELVVELRRIAAKEKNVEESGRFSMVVRPLRIEVEVLALPTRFPRDRFDQEGVDLRQRVVTREAAERVRERGVAAGVVERMPRLVQKALVVVQAPLRARDEVDDARRVGSDDARARAFLRPVVEVELDVVVAREVEAELRQRLETDGHRAVLRVEGSERRHAPQVGDVVRGRLVVPFRAENPVGPAFPKLRPRSVLRFGGGTENVCQLVQIDPLALGATPDDVGHTRELSVQGLAHPHELEPRVVEPGGGIARERAQLVPTRIVVEQGEHGLGRSEWKGLAAKLDPLGEDRVLELVGALGELRNDDSPQARFTEPVSAFTRQTDGGCVLVARVL